MMKQFYLKITCLFVFIFSIGSISAQCPNFTATTSSTASLCQASGTVTVTLGGTLTNISQVQYGLSGTTNTRVPFSINPQESNVLSNVPAGTYTVSVRAFCSVDASYNVVKTLANVVVEGTYKVPSVSFNSATSRKSYTTCGTGIIALNVTDGSGTFTFNITSGPTGAPLGPVTPTKSGTVYTLPGENYPAGDYTVLINDGCYTSVATFTLDGISTFPPTGITETRIYIVQTDGACSSISVAPTSVGSSTPDFYRYYTNGMYEIGIGKTGGPMPTNWYTWTSSSRFTADLSPYTLGDFYTAGSLTIYLRVKGCPNTYTTTTTQFYNVPFFYGSYSSRCSDYLYTFTPYTYYYSMVCFPVTAKIVETATPANVKYNQVISASTAFSGTSVALDYGVNYTLTLVDAAGKQLQNLYPSYTRPDIYIYTISDIPCSNTYNYQFYTQLQCYPVNVTITDVATNTVAFTYTLTNQNTVNAPLEYGKAYKFTAVYPNAVPALTVNKDIAARVAPAPTFAFTQYLGSYCTEDWGYGYVYTTGTVSTFPVGTKFTLEGPAGYTTQTWTATYASSGYSFPYTTLPAGPYKLTIINGCGNQTPIEINYTGKGYYSGKNLDYDQQPVCGGLKIFPKGSMTYQGNNITTYYRLTSGPAGYDKTVVTAGGSFTLSTPGTYVLGTLYNNDATACVINSKTIVYTAPPMALDMTATSAYECTNGVGVITLKAQNGIAPYTYELWNKANTIKLVPDALVSSDAVHFTYGEADSTYTARITDACGNSFPSKVTMAKLTTARIVSADPPAVCSGETIVLKCLTLGTTTYRWTGPLGFDVPFQNTTRPNATPAMSGYYKMTVWPEFCGSPVTDSVYVTVYAPLAAGTVSAAQAVCVRTPANAITCAIAGGSGAYTYQWQSSLNGSSGWTNISGATAAAYTPAVLIQSGTMYYRVVVTDQCGTVNSNAIMVTNTPCYIPVNPNLRSRVAR